MVSFEQAHDEFIQSHLRRRTGERKGRLLRGHQHGEKLFLMNIWWILKGNFTYLHPEFEILDWRGRSYFADFCWKPPGPIKLLIEVKSYSHHVRDLDREGYCRELNRELFNQAMGYRVISFAYDDVEKRPDLCITLLRLYISTHFSSESSTNLHILAESEIIRLCFQLARDIRPIDISKHLRIDHRTAIKHLNVLCDKGWLNPIRGASGKRIIRYALSGGFGKWE
ncbi:hypothetical protein [Cohnella silvisoli]|uniref:DUF559 domain-containing protein n=1 Tax=Cohnella silvisoli TaxID=2873699 RepID=A0ABV1KXM9_9BACL|nr:hypothetical protein [Cohnella silvisoli]MCD9023990.1 hypothetical protein [Cohnella silvisoli]